MGKGGTRATPLSQWVARLSGVMEIPPEVALDIPKTTWVGRSQLQVSNHKGIVEYTPRCVRIRTRVGQLVVTGSRLKIESIFAGELIIDGEIVGVEFLG